jgi:NADPH:quinone reductase-like Zn-dependent oxidoreductase
MAKSRSLTWRILRFLSRGVLLTLLVAIAAGSVAYWRSDNACPQPDAPRPANGMNAWIHCEFGGPATLRIAVLEKPVPSDSQVLVRVRAAALNAADWHEMRGTPYIARFSMGLRKPSEIRIGVDFAGTVESVGRSVTAVKPGDEVFGARTGAFGEYVTVRESRVVPKPPNVTFEQAAAIPVAAITALQGVRDHGGVGLGTTVLVNGASGGVGTFAVQIAKALGARVTGVSSARNVELVRGLGADQVIDYTTTDFTTLPERYDVIIDNVGNHPLGAMQRVLKPGGTYVMIGGPAGTWIDPIPRVVGTRLRSWFGDQKLRFFIAQLNHADLMTLSELVASGKVTPTIDRTYPLAELPEAMRYIETGRARAKVVLRVTP